jgi:Rrf2 family protein
MPERFLLQILRQLVTHGILHSARGVDGGYTLDRPPERISLLEVIEAIDGPLNADLVSGEGATMPHEERLRATLNEITNAARSHLESVKLSDLMRTENGDPPKVASSAN